MKRRAKRVIKASKVAPERGMLSIAKLCYKSRSYFYWVLAVLLSLFIISMNLLKDDETSVNGSIFDAAMKMRWMHPKPSPDIVILDIDEQSLAKLAPEYGTWPWRRDVFAHALAELEFDEAKSIIFTILITDPDPDHVRSDQTLSFVSSESFVTVYPMVRLPKENDAFSKLEVCDLIPAGIMKCHKGQKVAAILPGLPGMQHDLGIINHKLDADGVLRHWNLLWQDEHWKMPTMVSGALSLANIKPKVVEGRPYILNWRSKKKSYTTISFSDYIDSLHGDHKFGKEFFKGKHVIISASALGLTVPKPTPEGMLNDGVIMATALDDAIHGTNLKPLPSWISLLATVLFIWLIGALFTFTKSQTRLDGIFAVIEGATVGVMALMVNYTTYFVDLTPLATFGMLYYGIGRFHHAMSNKVLMASSSYMDWLVHELRDHISGVGIVVFTEILKGKASHPLKFKKLQKELALKHLFLCTSPFQKSQVLESGNTAACIISLGDIDTLHETQYKLNLYLEKHGIQTKLSHTFEIPHTVKNNKAYISKFITSKTLISISELLSQEYTTTY